MQLLGLSSLLLALGAAVAHSQLANKTSVDGQLQSASAEYHAGRFAEAETRLETLLAHSPKTFEAHELLGLICAAESKYPKAVEELSKAAVLMPDSAEAHTNLATAFMHTGELSSAEKQFKQALTLDPGDYNANHNLAGFYLQSKQLSSAIPYLQHALNARPHSYNDGYDLALALFLTGQTGEAKASVEKLLLQRNSGELHNLLGQIDEKQQDFIEAANEFAAAAHLEPSEDNLFAWGSELLLHRTYDPAILVFRQASQRYPNSPRLFIGLGMALYALGSYDESIKSLMTAADLDPDDARCYLFLSKASLISSSQAEQVIERFQHYSELEPHNAMAQYYYAMSLWKEKRTSGFAADLPKIQSLLQSSVSLDGSLALPHLQLGTLYADQHEYAQAFPELQRAARLDPGLADAHYRLGQYYVHAGDKDQAQKEFQLSQELNSKRLAEIDKERAEVQQFVVSAKSPSLSTP